jgi:hypothetical protein
VSSSDTARREPVIGMTPATGGEVEDLLEPVWSWPQRTMPTEPVREAMPGSRAAATPQIEKPGASNRTPTHPRSRAPPLPGDQRAPLPPGVKAKAPPGGLQPALTPGGGDGARPHPGTRPAPKTPINPTNPQQPLDTPPLLQGMPISRPGVLYRRSGGWRPPAAGNRCGTVVAYPANRDTCGRGSP